MSETVSDNLFFTCFVIGGTAIALLYLGTMAWLMWQEWKETKDQSPIPPKDPGNGEPP